MVVDESPACPLVHCGVYMAIDLPQEEAFQNVEANEKVIDANDTQNESTEGGKTRYGLQGNLRDMRAVSRHQCRRIGVEDAVVVHTGDLRHRCTRRVAREEG